MITVIVVIIIVLKRVVYVIVFVDFSPQTPLTIYRGVLGSRGKEKTLSKSSLYVRVDHGKRIKRQYVRSSFCPSRTTFIGAVDSEQTPHSLLTYVQTFSLPFIRSGLPTREWLADRSKLCQVAYLSYVVVYR